MPSSSWRAIAVFTAGYAWPRITGPSAIGKSRYSLPSTSQTDAPLARATKAGATPWTHCVGPFETVCDAPGINARARSSRRADSPRGRDDGWAGAGTTASGCQQSANFARHPHHVGIGHAGKHGERQRGFVVALGVGAAGGVGGTVTERPVERVVVDGDVVQLRSDVGRTQAM